MRFAIFLFAATLYGQAAVEAGLGAGRAVTSTAPAAGLGRSIAGAFGSLEKTLNSDKTRSSAPAAQAAPEVRPLPAIRPPEDVRKVEVGITYAELIDRYGPPLLEMSFETGLKKLTYPRREGSTRIDIVEGKVAAVVPPR